MPTSAETDVKLAAAAGAGTAEGLNLKSGESRFTTPTVREFFRAPLFWVILALKLILGSLVASTYLRDLFVPFVNYFVESHFSNPWVHFAASGQLNAFPYPPVMLYLLAIPRFLFGFLLPSGTNTVTWMHLLVMRLPLLTCDLAVAITLLHWFPGRVQRVLKYYWASPLAIYITYWHGQLDIMPTALFVGSLYFLRLRRFNQAMLVFGLALATKTHLLVALPFLLVYLYQETDLLTTVRGAATSLGVYFAILAPEILRPEFRKMVFGTQEQARLTQLQVAMGSNMWLLVAPAAILLLWFRFLAYRHRNWDLLMLFQAILFSVFILLVPPAPGYVLWSLPFLVYYVCRGRNTDAVPLACYNFFYIAFFWLQKNSDLFDAWRVVAPSIAGLATPYEFIARMNPPLALLLQKVGFTLMEASLAGIIMVVYLTGVRRNDAYRARSTPVMLGIAGDSGAGKDTFVQLILPLLSENRTTVVAGDDYHRWPRGHEMWRIYTPLNLRANNLHKQHSDAITFSMGQSVLKGTYDHSSGRFTEDRLVDANEIVILQGLHTLASEPLRKMYDLAVFLDPDEDLRCRWKLRRDHKARGYSQEQVLQAIEDREADRHAFILPQRRNADLVVSWQKSSPADSLEADSEPALALQVVAASSFNFTELAGALRSAGLRVEHDPLADAQWQTFRLDGEISMSTLEQISQTFLQDPMRVLRSPKFQSGLPGCLQLIFACCLTQKVCWRNLQFSS